MILVGYSAAIYLIPLPTITPTYQPVLVPDGIKKPLVWPSYGQTAIGAVGYGILDTHGAIKSVPTASVAKVLTALAVLKQHPLLLGEQGPNITISIDDVATYQKYVAVSGSVVQVQAGEQLTEYQALQALLLPSANNVADLLATWAFGSMPQYTTFANSFAKTLGLKQTTVMDASGFSAKTVSTASDLVLLGENIMDNPVLAEIVNQSQANLPVVGTIRNVNTLLGKHEIVGIKTGNTDEAGGCFMVAARHKVDANHSVMIVTVILGAPDLDSAISTTLPLLDSAAANFTVQTAVPRHTRVGSYTTAWGKQADAETTQDLTGIVWNPNPPKVITTLVPITVKHPPKNNQAGLIKATFGRREESATITAEPLSNPDFLWRLSHPHLLFNL
ncbi:MAG: hypothetical protein NVS1B7_6770 [Candidatus Saccharimonadales bacterium]